MINEVGLPELRPPSREERRGVRGLYYCDWFEDYTAKLASAVSSQGHDVTVIVRESAPEFRGRTADADELRQALRNNVTHLDVLPGRYWSLTSLSRIRERRRTADGVRFDYFHLQQTGDPRFLWTALRIPTIVTLHEPRRRVGYRTKRGFRTFSANAVLRAYRLLCAGIIVHTPSGFDALSPREKQKAVIIPHGVSPAVIERQADSKTILFFGNAQRYKGLDTLLAAMSEVWKSEPEAELRVLASPADDQCRRETSDNRISASWDGYSDSELRAALASARAVCLPYLMGGGSGAGADAYGAGTPIVASDLEGLRELVSAEELLVRPGDVADLARALVAVLQRDYAPPAVNADLTWPTVASKHLEAYSTAISRRKRTE